MASDFFTRVPNGKVRHYDGFVHIGWLEERVSVNIEQDQLSVQYFNRNDQITGWDMQLSQIEQAIRLVQALIEASTHEVECS